MKPRVPLANIQRKPERNGFAGMSDLVISAGVGTLLIMASGVALQSTGTLISEMTMILEQLPNNTKVGLTSFSSSGYGNHKEWNESKNGLVRLGDEG